MKKKRLFTTLIATTFIAYSLASCSSSTNDNSTSNATTTVDTTTVNTTTVATTTANTTTVATTTVDTTTVSTTTENNILIAPTTTVDTTTAPTTTAATTTVDTTTANTTTVDTTTANTTTAATTTVDTTTANTTTAATTTVSTTTEDITQVAPITTVDIISTTPEISSYATVFLSKVYQEFNESFPNLLYDEFASNVIITTTESDIKYEYSDSYIKLDSNGNFLDKEIAYSNPDNSGIITYKFLDNEWVTTKVLVNINGKLKETYALYYKEDNTLLYKCESTYDETGREDTSTKSEYLNGEWFIIDRYESVNNHIVLIYHIDLDYTSFKPKNRYEYTYNENYFVSSSKVSNYIDDEWVYISKTEVTYDEKYNIVSYIESKYINNGWVATNEAIYINGEYKDLYYITLNEDNTFESKTEYTYDENGDYTSETNYSYINGEFILMDKYLYLDGKRVLVEGYAYINNEVKPTLIIKLKSNNTFKSKKEYEYDDSGNLLVYKESSYDSTEFIYTYKYEYTYDDNNNMLTEIRYQYINGEWVKISEYVYINNNAKKIYSLTLNADNTFNKLGLSTYDENGNEIVYITAKYVDGSWVYNYKYEYGYNEKGLRTSEKVTKYVNNVGEYYEMYEYDYNDESKKILKIYSIYNEGKWVYKYKYEYIYEDDIVVNEIDSDYINGEWIVTRGYSLVNSKLKLQYVITLNSDNSFDQKIEYTYNDDVVLYITTCSKYKDGEWVYDYKYEYIFDDQGNKIDTIYYDYIDGEWKLKEY